MYSSVTRARSVSSMRSTKVPLVLRANAQSYSAVRMLPTCRSPLGDGGNRTRTDRWPSVTDDHPVPERPDALDRHRYLVAALQRPDPGRGPGQQDVTGQQRHDLADVGDQCRYIMQHFGGARPLLDLTVDRRGQGEVGRVGHGLDPRAERAERVEPLGPGPLAVPSLEVAGGDVVGARVAEDDVLGPFHRHLAAEPADDDRQLAFVVDPLGELDRVGDRVALPGDRRRRLEEQDGLRRWRPAHLTGVFGVIL